MCCFTHFLGKAFGCGFICFRVDIGKIRAIILFSAIYFIGLSHDGRFRFFSCVLSSVGRRNVCLFVLYNRHSVLLSDFALQISIQSQLRRPQYTAPVAARLSRYAKACHPEERYFRISTRAVRLDDTLFFSRLM